MKRIFFNVFGIFCASAVIMFAEPYLYDRRYSNETSSVISNNIYNDDNDTYYENKSEEHEEDDDNVLLYQQFEFNNSDIPWSYMISNFPHIFQGKEYPTGCEAVSTVMVLNYLGIDITIDEFINDYLPKEDIYSEGKGKNEVIYAADPNEYFIGDPYDKHSLGCYAPVIKKALDNYSTELYTASDISGTDMEDIIRDYILNDIPVIFWATMDMEQSKEGTKWKIIDSDREFTWISPEHCLVLIGYDRKYYYFSDPAKEEFITSYSRKTVEKRFEELGKQGVVIQPVH